MSTSGSGRANASMTAPGTRYGDGYDCRNAQSAARSCGVQSTCRPTMNATENRTKTFLGVRKLPSRYSGVVMPLLLSFLMTFIVSFISTWRGVGLSPDFARIWFGAWALSWVVAFPVLLAVLPLVRRATAAIVEVG